jgi:hypothetical protein
MLLRIKLAAALAAAVVVSSHVTAREDDPELKRDAVSRVVESHDPALSIGIGRVYVKQTALLAARALLTESGRAAGLDKSRWNLQAGEWQAAERELMEGVDNLIQRKVARGAWVQEAWSELIAKTLNAE